MDYFEEMGWRPVDSEQREEHQQLLLARFLIDCGFIEPSKIKNPPASKEVVKNLERRTVTTPSDTEQCPICLATLLSGDIMLILPCSHEFHERCILPWLNVTNSCPKCRRELKTDDPAYEQNKIHHQRAVEREQDIENLHNSMFT